MVVLFAQRLNRTKMVQFAVGDGTIPARCGTRGAYTYYTSKAIKCELLVLSLLTGVYRFGCARLKTLKQTLMCFCLSCMCASVRHEDTERLEDMAGSKRKVAKTKRHFSSLGSFKCFILFEFVLPFLLPARFLCLSRLCFMTKWTFVERGAHNRDWLNRRQTLWVCSMDFRFASSSTFVLVFFSGRHGKYLQQFAA